MKLLILLLALACLTADAREKPTIATSCTECDSSIVIPWGDGTYRSVIEVGGVGFAPNAIVRVMWSTSDVEWSFDCLTNSDGAFSELWTGVPPGDYVVIATGDGGGHIGNWRDKTATFISGLRKASEAKENVEFH